MFKLQVSDTDVTNGTIAISWCLDQETLKYLSDHSITDPQVVIVVSPEDNYHLKKEVRQVVPLKDLMAYVEFRVPGKNRIWGFISHKSKREARDFFLTKARDIYITMVLSSEGNEWSWIFDDESNGKREPKLASETLSVEVPEGVFAPEPAEWEKDWVNHFFREKAVDQCHFRKRRLLAYTVQPIIFFFQLVLRFLFLLVALAIGARDISLKPLLHPLAYSLGDAWNVCGGGSYFIPELPEDGDVDWSPTASFRSTMWYIVRKLRFIVFMPMVLGLLTLLFLSHQVTVALTILGFVILLVAFALVFAVFLATGGLESVAKWVSERMSNSKVGLWYLEKEEMDLLICEQDRQPVTFDKLPAHKKTLRLRFQDLKSKVCKPFSG